MTKGQKPLCQSQILNRMKIKSFLFPLNENTNPSSLKTIWDTDFGPLYLLPDGRRAAMPSFHQEEVLYVSGRDVVARSKEEADVAQYQMAVEQRAETIAAIMNGKLVSANSKTGEVTLRLEIQGIQGQEGLLKLSDTWANHILTLNK